MGYQTPEIVAPSRTARRSACLFLLVVGLIAGVVLDRAVIGRGVPDTPATVATLSAAPTLLTRENYARIKPGMTSWEVGDILGPGTVVRERGVVVRPDGVQEEFDNEPGVSRRWGGPAPKGAKSHVDRTMIWREGPRSFQVGFVDDKVDSKGCEGPY